MSEDAVGSGPSHRLSYVRVAVTDLHAASQFATNLLGLELSAKADGAAFFRSDTRHHTLALVANGADAIGIEVHDLDATVARLTQAGHLAREATPDECAQRLVGRAVFTQDASGNAVELVVRPAFVGTRFHPPRDAGVTGLRTAALRSLDIAGDSAFWTVALGAEVSDWVDGITYLRFDSAHHVIVLYPSTRAGLLYHAYTVDGLDALMRNQNFLAGHQVEIVQGPGRETVSGDIFLRVRGPGAIFAYAHADGAGLRFGQPRRFIRDPDSLCAWGSRCETVPELTAGTC